MFLSYTKILVSVITLSLSVVAFFVLNGPNYDYYEYKEENEVIEIAYVGYESSGYIIEEEVLYYPSTVWQVEIPVINLIGPIHSRNNYGNNGQICRTF